jgi:tetratricopeptide (TPR) repeat protein
MTNTAAGTPRSIEQMECAIAEFEDQSFAEVELIAKLLRNSSILLEAREYRLAFNLLRNLLIRCPESPQGLLNMGLCLRELGRYEEALKCFRALVKIQGGLGRNDQKFEAQVLIAETLYLGERDEMALAAYREVLKHVPENYRQLFDVYKCIGNIHVRAGDFEAAEEFYNKAYTLNSESDVLMVNYGTLEIQRENFEAAVLRFRRAVEISPENDKGWVGLALVHRQMGDLDLSWANVQRALDINQKNRTAIRLVVEWAVRDQRFALAITRLQEYLEADGEDAEMSFMLAKIFTHIGRLREARLEMERVLALDPVIENGEAVITALDRELARIRGLEKA